mgnify:FL=1
MAQGRRVQVPARGQAAPVAPAARPAQRPAAAPAAAQSPRAARPMPKAAPRRKMAPAPSRMPPAGTPSPQGMDTADQSRAAKDAALSKITKNFGIPADLLNEFTMQELQIMPRLLQKMEKTGILPGGDKAAERAGFGGGPSPQQSADNDLRALAIPIG